MDICLLVINYNGMCFLPLYFPSLQLQCLQNDIDIYVTDDQSTDESITYLQEITGNFIINQGENHGFAANVNNGIRFAMSHKKYDYLIVANNDIVVQDGFFEVLKKTLNVLSVTDCKFGLLGVNEIFPMYKELAEKYSYAKFDPTSIKKVDNIPGFFFVIAAELIGQVGYLDESYFMYGEDNDYFARTIKNGYRIYQSELPVIHFSEGSSNNSQVTSWYVYRNAFLYARKNLDFVGIIRMFLSFIYKIYNPFYQPQNPGNERIVRNGFFYNNYLLAKSILWNVSDCLLPKKIKKIKRY